MPTPNFDTEGNASGERRAAARIMVQLASSAREPGREKVAVQIVDLSPQGCRIEMHCNAFAEQWILLSIAGLTPQYSRIVWQEQGFAGIEFATPLDQTAFESLVKFTRTTERSIAALRNIGDRARQMARRTVESRGKRALLEISKDCSVAAFVKTFQLTHVPNGEARVGQLTSVMVRRSEF